MTTLTTQDPRFLPVTFNGRTYITSTLLHKQKRGGGMSKYERVDSFLRMIREIDCFGRLLENSDIVELNKNTNKIKRSTDLVLLIKSNGYRPLFLISPTAQKEIEHFLDDEASKDSAVQSSQVSAVLGGGYGLESAGKLIDFLYGNYKQLEAQNLQLIQERDHAIRTKGQISNSREASVMGQLSVVKTKCRELETRLETFKEAEGYKPFDAICPGLSNYEKGIVFKHLEREGIECRKQYIGDEPYPTKCFRPGDVDVKEVEAIVNKLRKGV